MHLDVIVIGGSYAGMSAALQIARARRNVGVIDAGLRRNRFAWTSHGFLGQDGRAPDSISADAREQLLLYPNLTWLDMTATTVIDKGGVFIVETLEGLQYQADRLVLALGVADQLPAIPGLEERWGSSVFHCPYCHGYELQSGRLGVLATGPFSMHQAMLIPDWGHTTFFTNGAFEPDSEEMGRLAARGVVVEPVSVTEIAGHADVILGDHNRVGRPVYGDANASHQSACQRLGCAFDDGPSGRFVRTDAMKETTVQGVYACGDAARAFGSVAIAVGDGAIAGAAAHQSLIFR